MQVTGSYFNYLTLTNLLAPLGVKGSGNLVMEVFSAALGNLQDKINQELFSDESAVALKQFYNDISTLGTEAKKLTLTDYESVFNDRTPVSSDPGVLTASAMDAFTSATGATEATYDISVTRLAQTQSNEGTELTGDGATGVNTGTNTFIITVDGQDHELSIEVTEGDTNEVVLQKMESAIYGADLGVSAEVTPGALEGTMRLTITADSMGEAGTFTISDASGNAVAATGAGNVTTTAQDAAYSVDGTDYTSASNTVFLDGDMVAVNLLAAGESVLTVAPDAGAVQDSIAGLISEINSFTDSLNNNSAYLKDDILSTIDSFIDDHRRELSALGITKDEDGMLQIDEDKLAAAAGQELSDIREAFGGFDGLAVQLDSYASRVSTDSPINYAKETESLSSYQKDYVFDASGSMLEQIIRGSLLDALF